ncbi:hypothetical protein AGLY_007939 [Aphis glycines]|uniref:Transposable element P transposase-like RNase H C-terminal domain-containing protein n=1 Tax=Aphis glycines TaxID=307491 RepID=A0A6G0TML7_APHGL|nr:hypothetical protein AGLY_007939 [Aphis glycines]
MFFSAIRVKGGFNNNPTASQFEAVYKHLIVHNEIKTSNGANCELQDLTPIVVTSSTHITNTNYLDLLYKAEEDSEKNQITDDLVFLSPNEIQYIDDVVEYIFGFVVRKISNKMSCLNCITAITKKNYDNAFSLIQAKSRGGLIKPSRDVVVLCKTVEHIFKSYQHKLSSIPNNPINYLITKTMSKIQIYHFNCISDHILNQSPLNNYLLQIIHLTLKMYLTVQLHHSNKTTSEPIQQIRSFFNKNCSF